MMFEIAKSMPNFWHTTFYDCVSISIKPVDCTGFAFGGFLLLNH
jgi:hypothetical protein